MSYVSLFNNTSHHCLSAMMLDDESYGDNSQSTTSGGYLFSSVLAAHCFTSPFQKNPPVYPLICSARTELHPIEWVWFGYGKRGYDNDY